ncbi:MAG: AMP-binding protein [Clostridiales bacterium]|jgi:acetyl-CoA synthetase|nr:AMP-binding protein [Clostridiales bacterium]
MNKVKQVAERIKDLRIITGKTPEEMAAATDVSLSDYTAAESGKTDFSFTFLFKCAEAFNIDVSDLISGESPKLSTYQLVRKGEGDALPPKKEFNYYNLNSLKKGKNSQPYLVTAKYSKQIENSPISVTEHEGEEFDYVLKGKLKIQIDSYTEILEEGDSIYYDSGKKHGMIAVGGADAEFIAVVIPPKGKDISEVEKSTATAHGGEHAARYGKNVSETEKDAARGGEHSAKYDKDKNETEKDAAARGGERIAKYGKDRNKTEKDAARGGERTAKYRYAQKPVYEKFVKLEEDANGALKKIEFIQDDDFNFAFDVVDYLGKNKPDKTAMIWLGKNKEEKRFTFSDMMQNSARAANYFKSLGIKKGDRVMLVLKRHHQFWSAILGLHKIGAAAVPATNLLTKKDFEYRFNAAGIKALVITGDGGVAEQAAAALKNSPTVERVMIANGKKEGLGFLDYDGGLENSSPVFEKPKGEEGVNCYKDSMLMYFTSGTTGYPKIAAQPFTYALGHFVTAKYWQNVDPDGVHFTISDTGWGKAVWGKLYGQWLCEAAVLTYDFDKFEASDILPLFKNYGITTFCAPPTMYRFFIKEDLKKYDLSSLKNAVTAGEALNPEVFDRFYEATGLKLMEGYGQTETTLTVATLLGTEPRPASMGKPTPQYNIDVVTPDGAKAKVGEIGEIVLRTDKEKPVGLFNGYYLDKEKTEAAWNGGIYHTGDMAWKDEDGYYWYVGRTDDLIKSSGYRIGPFEIESVIMELPYVLECAVTGIPDPEGTRGQLVKASIVLIKGAEGSESLKREIQEYVKKHTAPYKYPREVEFAAELPKTISGKIKRSEIK